MENLKRFNKVRMLAQTINEPNFKRQYNNIIIPILEKYRNHIASDGEMRTRIIQAIKSIQHISKDCQYVGNKNYSDFSEHEKLIQVEYLCLDVLKEFNH